ADRIRRMAAEGERRLRGAKSLISMAQDQVEAHQRLDELNRTLARQRAEQSAAPLITRDGVVELNKRVGTLLDATQKLADVELTQVSEAISLRKQTRWIVGLSVGIFVVSVAALLVALLK